MSTSIIQRAEAGFLAKQRVTAPTQDLPKESKLKGVWDICPFDVFVGQLQSFSSVRNGTSVMQSWVHTSSLQTLLQQKLIPSCCSLCP